MVELARPPAALLVAALAAMALPMAGCLEDPLGIRGPLGDGPDSWPGFVGGGPWLNSEPLSKDALRGQVVLVDFWTYSCINCIRTLPHLVAWHEAYADHGLVMVGVHSPEFDFERNVTNVLHAAEEHGLEYPIVLDNDYAIWRAWENRFWPHKFLVSASGEVVWDRIGEGGYVDTELRLRQELRAAGYTNLPPVVEPLPGMADGSRASDVTHEIYVGYGRQPDALADVAYRPDEVVDHGDGTTRAAAPERDALYLAGRWHHGRQALTTVANASMELTFRAGAANVVLAGPSGACLDVEIDGRPVAASLRGPSIDVDADGQTQICLRGNDAYHLFAGPVAQHHLHLRLPPGVSVYAFAFGSYDGGGPP